MQDLMPHPSCIGIIAGAGPDAGVTFWRQVLVASRRRKGENYRGDLDAPRVRVISEPALGCVSDMEANRDKLLHSLREILTELDATCHSIVLACHALQGLAKEAHPDVAARKLVLLPELICNFVRSRGLKTVGLFGAPSVSAMPTSSPYSDLWNVTEVEKPKDPDAVLTLIMDAKRIGATHPEILARLSSMISGYAANSILLACTDFSGLDFSVNGKVIVDVLELAAGIVTASD